MNRKTGLIIVEALTIASLAAGASAGEEPLTLAGSKNKVPGDSAPAAAVGLNSARTSTETDIWKGEIGDGLRKGTWRSTIEAGSAWGHRMLGGDVTHDLVLAGVDLGYVFSDVVADSHWYRGNWEFRTELFGGEQYRPDMAYVVGLTPFLRYDFATGTRWVPFFEAGAGVTATDIGHPDLGGTFQFNLQPGLGLHVFLTRRTAATISYHLLHMSNAGLSSPNLGANAHLVSLGFTWFF